MLIPNQRPIGVKKYSLPIILAVLMLVIAGCTENKTTSFEDAVTGLKDLAAIDPNSAIDAIKAIPEIYDIEAEKELASIKAKAEAEAYAKQENLKRNMLLMGGICIAAGIVALFFGRKLIVVLALAGAIGCGAVWSMVNASVTHAKLLANVTVGICLVGCGLIFVIFVFMAFKYRKALVQVVTGNEALKFMYAKSSNLRTEFTAAQRNAQSKDTVKIVDKIRKNGGT